MCQSPWASPHIPVHCCTQADQPNTTRISELGRLVDDTPVHFPPPLSLRLLQPRLALIHCPLTVSSRSLTSYRLIVLFSKRNMSVLCSLRLDVKDILSGSDEETALLLSPGSSLSRLQTGNRKPPKRTSRRRCPHPKHPAKAHAVGHRSAKLDQLHSTPADRHLTPSWPSAPCR